MEIGRAETLHKFFREILKISGGRIFLLVFLQMALSGMSVGQAFVLREIVNNAADRNREGFLFSIISFLLVLVLQISVRSVVYSLEEYVRSGLENQLKKRLFENLLKKEYADVSRTHSGEWMNRFTSDTVVVANGLVELIPGAAGMVVKLCCSAAAIFCILPRLVIFVLPAGIAMAFLSGMLRKTMKRLHREMQEADGQLRILIQERLGALMVLHAFSVEDMVQKDAECKMMIHRKRRMRKNIFSNFCSIGLAVSISLLYFTCMVYCGYGILNGRLDYGTFPALMQLVGQIQTPFVYMSGFVSRWYAVAASAERLMEPEVFPDRKKEEYSLTYIKQFYCTDFQGLLLENGFFSYPDMGIGENKKGITDVSMKICKEESVAFLGKSGCGKSTVLKLFMCLYPLDAGKLVIKARSGEICLDARWQKLFAYVPQGNYLMSGSIREIIAFYAKEDMQDEGRIWKVLAIACADRFVKELKYGLDTVLGERGIGLSEGQMQRLAIARAIFSEHPILLLDECTSALDEDTEYRVLRNLRRMTDRTVVLVTHRPAALEICDKIIRFEEENGNGTEELKIERD